MRGEALAALGLPLMVQSFRYHEVLVGISRISFQMNASSLPQCQAHDRD